MINEQVHSAAAAGTFTIGGDLTVNRLGYGAMRITGPGTWGPPVDKVILPIPGTSSIKHLEENIAAASLELPQAAYDELSEVSHPAAGLRE
jgi:aryl-alcohol dehydrogenase-like predicted oxidoreductase